MAQGTEGFYARAGRMLYLLLCGGEKGSQDADIRNARAVWRELNPPAKRTARKE
jgi:putative component of toxin-antitoxin plasmid stabilization module